jgi:hypothetical protein
VTAVDVVKTRWSGAASVRIPATIIDEDADGTWLLAPRLTPHLFETGWVGYVQHEPILGLIPSGGQPWTAWFGPANGKVDLSSSYRVDRGAGVVEFCDVELDVVWRWGEPARIVDQDEFDVLDMPSSQAVAFSTAAHDVCDLVDRGLPPFDSSKRDRVIALGGSPDATYGVWMGGVAPDLLVDVKHVLGEELVEPWWKRQVAGEGWLFAGGIGDGVLALAWIEPDTNTAPTLVASADIPITALVLEAAATLADYPAPRVL